MLIVIERLFDLPISKSVQHFNYTSISKRLYYNNKNKHSNHQIRSLTSTTHVWLIKGSPWNYRRRFQKQFPQKQTIKTRHILRKVYSTSSSLNLETKNVSNPPSNSKMLVFWFCTSIQLHFVCRHERNVLR